MEIIIIDKNVNIMPHMNKIFLIQSVHLAVKIGTYVKDPNQLITLLKRYFKAINKQKINKRNDNLYYIL